jgi:hypothetical protein
MQCLAAHSELSADAIVASTMNNVHLGDTNKVTKSGIMLSAYCKKKLEFADTVAATAEYLSENGGKSKPLRKPRKNAIASTVTNILAQQPQKKQPNETTLADCKGFENNNGDHLQPQQLQRLNRGRFQKFPSNTKRNARERKRVKTINDFFAQLQKYLPHTRPSIASIGSTSTSSTSATPVRSLSGKKLSKVETLKAAIEYIEYLQLCAPNATNSTAFSNNNGGNSGSKSYLYNGNSIASVNNLSNLISVAYSGSTTTATLTATANVSSSNGPSSLSSSPSSIMSSPCSSSHSSASSSSSSSPISCKLLSGVGVGTGSSNGSYGSVSPMCSLGSMVTPVKSPMTSAAASGAVGVAAASLTTPLSNNTSRILNTGLIDQAARSPTSVAASTSMPYAQASSYSVEPLASISTCSPKKSTLIGAEQQSAAPIETSHVYIKTESIMNENNALGMTSGADSHQLTSTNFK